LRAKEALFPDDDRFQIPMAKMLGAMAANINRDPESYDETLSDLHQLCAKYGVDQTAVQVPPRVQGDKPRLQGLIQPPAGGAPTLAVNCLEAGVHEVASAARLASALLPELVIQ